MALLSTLDEVITIVFPYPPAALSPNARVHWTARAAATKAYRGDCYLHAANARVKLKSPVVATVRFLVPDTGRRRDGDNALAMTKALWDGCVNAGLLPGDSARVLIVAMARPLFVKGRWGVEITFEEAT